MSRFLAPRETRKPVYFGEAVLPPLPLPFGREAGRSGPSPGRLKSG